MFFDIFEKLCKEKGISPTQATIDCGAPKSNVTYWKKSGTTPNSKVLSNIANYFNVSVDYLLGNSNEKNKAPSEPDNSDDTLMFALYGGDNNSDITPDMLEDVRNYAKFIRERNKKKK